jgi:hypothetical protein
MGGNDTIYGGNGDDSLTGGTGNDVFVFSRKGGLDTITDFNLGNDKFGFAKVSWFGPPPLSEDITIKNCVVIDTNSENVPSAPDSEHRYFLVTKNAIWLDEDGSNPDAPIKIAEFDQQHTALTIDSFVFV